MNEFHWVIARAKCSIAQVFDKLVLDVKEDIETRQALRPKDNFSGEGYSHAFHLSATPEKFTVSLVGRLTDKKSITFTLEKDTIAIHDGNERLVFRIWVTLNGEARCIAKIADQEMEFWQVRQKALEALFFESGVPFNIPA